MTDRNQESFWWTDVEHVWLDWRVELF